MLTRNCAPASERWACQMFVCHIGPQRVGKLAHMTSSGPALAAMRIRCDCAGCEAPHAETSHVWSPEIRDRLEQDRQEPAMRPDAAPPLVPIPLTRTDGPPAQPGHAAVDKGHRVWYMKAEDLSRPGRRNADGRNALLPDVLGCHRARHEVIVAALAAAMSFCRHIQYGGW